MNRNEPSRLDYTLKNWRWWATSPIMIPLSIIVLILVMIEAFTKSINAIMLLAIEKIVFWTRAHLDDTVGIN